MGLLNARMWSWRLLSLGLALTLVGIGLGRWLMQATWTEEELEQVVVTTLQREVPASFMVTGTLDLTATVSARSTKYLFPGILNLSLGTTESLLRSPGRVSYGFDVRSLTPDHIHLQDDGVIEVDLPDLLVYAVEPDLERMEINTRVGWARLQRSSGNEQELRALQSLERAFRDQANKHLRTSDQPGIHTARALAVMLAPPLQAVGMDRPRFRFHFGSGLTLEPDLDYNSPASTDAPS